MSTRTRILVVDDDPPLREVVRYALVRASFDVIEAADGEQALAEFDAHRPALVVLDVGLPGLDGLSVCRRLRGRSSVPILFLSCRGEEVDRVLGLDFGGDDYVTKPFSPRELVSRIRAVLRRGPSSALHGPQLCAGRLRLSPATHRTHVDAQEIKLTATEFRLLAALMRAGQRVLPRVELSRIAYPDERHVSDRTIDSHVRRIRAKLRTHGIDPIETVHGVGLRLRTAVEP